MKRYKIYKPLGVMEVVEDGKWVKAEDALAEIEKARQEGYDKAKQEGPLDWQRQVDAARKEGYDQAVEGDEKAHRKQGAEEKAKEIADMLQRWMDEDPKGGDWNDGFDSACRQAIGRINKAQPPAAPRLPEKLGRLFAPDDNEERLRDAVNALIDVVADLLKARE